MSRASQSMAPLAQLVGARRGRRYLVNPRFQLKYTAMLIGAVLVVMVVLGLVIWDLASAAAGHAEYAALQAEKALTESRTASRIVRTSSLEAAADNPDLVKIIEEETIAADKTAEENLAEVRSRRATVERDKKSLLYLLLGGGTALVAILALMGIYLTHKIVGPALRMKRLLRQVSTGRLSVTERLRKGDELGDLFDTFLQMTYGLRARDLDRLATLDLAIVEARAAGTSRVVIEKLEALRAQFTHGAHARGSSRLSRPDFGPGERPPPRARP